MKRYILIEETACPGCGGDGWIFDDTCPQCEGEGVVRVQVALVPEPVAEVLIDQFGEAIPFHGRPIPNKEVSIRDYYGL